MLVCMRVNETEEEIEGINSCELEPIQRVQRDESLGTSRLGRALCSDLHVHNFHQEEAILATVYKLRRL